jgi:magnesium transporter
MKITVWTEDTIVHCGLDQLQHYLAQPQAIVWMDLGIGEHDALLRDTFKFHPSAIEDTTNDRQRPKAQDYEGYVFVILNTVSCVRAQDKPDKTISVHKSAQNKVDDGIDFYEINAFVGKNYIVTIHRNAEPVVDELTRRLTRTPRPTHLSVGYLLYLLLDTTLEQYTPVMDHIGDTLDQIEDTLLTRPQSLELAQLFRLRRTLGEMWRVVVHQREMMSVLHDQEMYAHNESLQYYMRDVTDHTIHISDTVNTLRENVHNMVELYMSTTSNRLNIVVTRLTVFTLIIGTLTVISGFYGMNFTQDQTFVPSLTADNGVLTVVLMMVGAVVGLLAAFRLLKWF